MNKIMKYIFILGIILTVFSICFIGFNLTDLENQFNHGDGVFENKSVTFKLNELNYIDLKTSNTKVNVRASKNEQYEIEYQETKYQKYEYSIENNKLIFRENKRKARLFTYGINFGITRESVLTVYVPISEIDLEIKTSNSSIKLVDKLAFKNIKLTSSNGTINIKNQTITGKLITKTSNAGINISNIKTSNTISANTSNGSIKIDNASASGLKVDTSNSSIKINNIRNTSIIVAKTSNGNIEFDKLIGNDIDLKTSNGNVEGSIIGSDYDFNKEMKTSNGSIEINNNKFGNAYNRDEKDAEKELKIKSSNGDIEISFTK